MRRYRSATVVRERGVQNPTIPPVDVAGRLIRRYITTTVGRVCGTQPAGASRSFYRPVNAALEIDNGRSRARKSKPH